MKTKKNIIRLSLLAGLLACVLVAGSLFASGADTANPSLNVIVSVPSEPVDAGKTFEAVVKIADENVESFKLAGLQVELAYDTDKLTVTAEDITYTLNTEESIAVSGVTNGTVKFVCVKNEFTNLAGYTTLGDLFRVKFTARTPITNPAALFGNDSITYVMGDVTAAEIVNSDAAYAGDKEAIALAILNTNLEIVVANSVGSVVVAPTPEGAGAMKKAELEALLGTSATVTAKNGVVGTGSKIIVDTEEADIIVKGDVDGDGVVTVFDAMMIKKAANANSTADKFAENDIKKFAADVDGDNTANDTDIDNLLKHVVGKDYIK